MRLQDRRRISRAQGMDLRRLMHCVEETTVDDLRAVELSLPGHQQGIVRHPGVRDQAAHRFPQAGGDKDLAFHERY